MKEQPRQDEMLDLGCWLGRRQAFGLIANRCSAADAECLRAMRDSGQYKMLGMTWEEFCRQRAGVSRRYADKLIGHLEEFGANYFRLSELIQISDGTYRLIAGAVSDDGLLHQGERIPLTRQNRKRLTAAVEALKPAQPVRSNAEKVLRRLSSVLDEVKSLDQSVLERSVIIGMLEEASLSLRRL